jgi:hypothetical protein
VGNNGAASLKTLTVWMGGLFNPEAFVTATRQCVAQVSYASPASIIIGTWSRDAYKTHKIKSVVL